MNLLREWLLVMGRTTTGQSGTVYDTRTTRSIDTHLAYLVRRIGYETKRESYVGMVQAIEWLYAEIDLLLDARLELMKR